MGGIVWLVLALSRQQYAHGGAGGSAALLVRVLVAARGLRA
jgi:hypothetical protein